MGQHVIGRHQRRRAHGGQAGQTPEPAPIVAAIEVMRRQINRSGGAALEIAQALGKGGAGIELGRRQGNQDLPRGGTVDLAQQIFQSDLALALGRPALAQREQPREPAIGLPVTGKSQQAGGIVKIEAHADQQPNPGLARRHVGPHHPGKGVAVGNGHRLMPQGRRLGHQLLRMRGPAEEGEIAGHLKFGVAGHGVDSSILSIANCFIDLTLLQRIAIFLSCWR